MAKAALAGGGLENTTALRVWTVEADDSEGAYKGCATANAGVKPAAMSAAATRISPLPRRCHLHG
jgi:hypothetical protein